MLINRLFKLMSDFIEDPRRIVFNRVQEWMSQAAYNECRYMLVPE